MKFTILALVILGVVAADVSHLNNMYLPPVLGHLSTKQHVSYAQEVEEIPQVSVQEVSDNSVAEDEQSQLAAGKLIVSSAQFGPVVSHQIKTANAVAHQVQAHAQQAVAAVFKAVPAAPGSEVYQSTYQQTVYHTGQANQEQQQQQAEQQYYTGLVYHEGQEAVEEQQQQQQQAEVDASPEEIVEEHHHVETYQPQQQLSAVHVEHQVAAVSAPSVQAGYYGQQSAGVSVGSSASSSSISSSSGIDTQYAANGGYVY